MARAITFTEEVILAYGIILIAFFTTLNVFSRTFLGFSLAFAEELCQFLIILVTFVGLSYGAAQGRHIRMTAIYDEVPFKYRRWLRIGICFFTAGLLSVLTCYGLSYAFTVFALGTVSPVMQISLGWVYLTAPLGLGMAALQYFLAGWKNIQSSEIHLSYMIPEVYQQPPMDGV